MHRKKKKKVTLINHDCLSILMLLYIMLYIMLAYLMLLTALFNAVCLHSASLFFAIDFCKCILFSCFFLGLLTHGLLNKNIILHHV